MAHQIDSAVVADLVGRHWAVDTIAYVLARPEDEIRRLAVAGGARPAPTRDAALSRRRRAAKGRA